MGPPGGRCRGAHKVNGDVVVGPLRGRVRGWRSGRCQTDSLPHTVICWGLCAFNVQPQALGVCSDGHCAFRKVLPSRQYCSCAAPLLRWASKWRSAEFGCCLGAGALTGSVEFWSAMQAWSLMSERL